MYLYKFCLHDWNVHLIWKLKFRKWKTFKILIAWLFLNILKIYQYWDFQRFLKVLELSIIEKKRFSVWLDISSSAVNIYTRARIGEGGNGQKGGQFWPNVTNLGKSLEKRAKVTNFWRCRRRKFLKVGLT